MKILLTESTSSAKRLHEVAAIRQDVAYFINGTIERAPTNPMYDPLVMVLVKNDWPCIWTKWAGTYRIPPKEIVGAVWVAVQALLEERPSIPRVFGGAFKDKGFLWGMLPGAEGIVARERLFTGGLGLFLEHACLCLANGMSLEKTMTATIKAAKQGGFTEIPR